MNLKYDMLKHKLNKNRKIIIGAIIIIVLLIVLYNILDRISKTSEVPEKLTYTSIREVVEYYKCKYIKEAKSKEENIEIDVVIEFDKDLYTGEESNERFFINFTQSIAKATKGKNFRIIDEKRAITIIGIMAKGESYLEKIYINGESNYFGNVDSKNTVYNYKQSPIVNLEINSEILKQVIKAKWKNRDINFGTRESIYREYNNYFDEGIKVRAIGADVFNIIFTKKYKGLIVNEVKVGMANNEIQKKLGKPAFGSIEEDILGYIGKDFYIFFTEEEVSIYRIQETDYSEFEKIIEEIENGYYGTELLNKLTNLWLDYDKYEYIEEYIVLRYALKGIQVQFNLDSNHGIILYNNYKGEFGNGITLDNLIRRESLFPENVYFKMDQDLIYISEQERYEEDKIKHSSDGYAGDFSDEDAENANESEYYYEELDFINGNYKNLRIVSKTKENIDADVELDDIITSYLWIDDYRLVYGVQNKGIYLYNMQNLKKQTLLETTEKVELEKYENSTLYYNKNKTLKAQ